MSPLSCLRRRQLMGMISMSRKELSRLEWLARVKRGEMPLRSASEKMRMSYRQAKRIWKRYQAQGEVGLVHGLRGKPSNRKIDAALREEVVRLFQEKYHDFGTTLAAEYLHEEDG